MNKTQIAVIVLGAISIAAHLLGQNQIGIAFTLAQAFFLILHIQDWTSKN